MTVIMPSPPGMAYRRALQAELKAYIEREKPTPAMIDAFRVAFRKGWEASKQNTFDLLSAMASEENNGKPP
jgi:hypothetical protein